MAKVERDTFARGEAHEVQYAVRRDRSIPAHTFFRALTRGEWQEDPDGVHKDEQVDAYLVFLHACQYLAAHGVPEHHKVVNDLRSGIWEFRCRSKRVSWYDVVGDGTYNEKRKIRDRVKSPFPEDHEWWWLPHFDPLIRLGYCFPKLGDKTEEFQIEETQAVREEDVEHDR